MIIEVLGDGITKEDCKDVPLRFGARGIVKKEDKFLLVHNKKWDFYTFPGGGIEENESKEDACYREVLEETGVKVKVLSLKTTVKEYFIDSKWTNFYYICEYIEMGEPNLTEEEIEVGMETVWLTLEEILDIFENNMTLHEHGPAIHQRELLGFIHSI